jgi:hypothetical protein
MRVAVPEPMDDGRCGLHAPAGRHAASQASRYYSAARPGRFFIIEISDIAPRDKKPAPMAVFRHQRRRISVPELVDAPASRDMAP